MSVHRPGFGCTSGGYDGRGTNTGREPIIAQTELANPVTGLRKAVDTRG